MSRIVTIAACLSLLVMAVPAEAGFVVDSCDVTFQDDPDHTKHSAEFLYDVGGDPALGKLLLDEGPVDQLGADPSLTCDGYYTASAVLWIVEDAVNETGVALTGWKAELDPAGDATFVVDAMHMPTSSHFGSYALSTDAKTLQFNAPDVVDPNESVHLEFFINVPFDGSGSQPFSFTLTQSAIPEPASVLFLGLGSCIGLLRRRGR